MISAGAHIELNIKALRHNVQRVREYAPKAKLMAVIKANAYGHGLLAVAKKVNDSVDAFAVARLDEAIFLREAGIQTRVLVLQGFTQLEELEYMQRHRLEPVIHTQTQVEVLESVSAGEAVTAWVKIDTGMNRLGLRPEQVEAVMQRLGTCRVVGQVNLMTHFANADDTQDEKTVQQLRLFNVSARQYSTEKSSANSAALISWPETHLDWVRPGLMIYGVSPVLQKTAQELNLLPVMSLYSKIIDIKPLKKGSAVGYGGSWVAEKDSLVGVVSIGYGDGYPRYAKQGTPMLINNRRAPLIGRVSMDMLTVDLTAHINTRPGDPVLLWGDQLPVEEIAACAGTIPYTLTCGITRRVLVRTKE